MEARQQAAGEGAMLPDEGGAATVCSRGPLVPTEQLTADAVQVCLFEM